MKYRVLKFMTRRVEGMKPYKVDSAIELTNEEAKPLLEHGFVRKIEKKVTKTKEEKMNQRKTK